jgi:hypothetical protein
MLGLRIIILASSDEPSLELAFVRIQKGLLQRVSAVPNFPRTCQQNS